MKQSFVRIARTLGAAGAMLVAPAALAQTWAEVGDAGELIGTAQVAAGSGPLTAITGNVGGSATADMFAVFVSDFSAFSASTVGGATFDTQLFLFRGDGIGIAVNDDAVGLQSTLPVGNALYSSLTAGIYYLAISAFNSDPQSSGGFIFPNTFSGVHGPTGPGGASALSGWAGAAGSGGNYSIALTGVTLIPLPSAVAMGSLGLLGVFGLGSRRRR